jgi:hypothetical protein
MGTKTWLKEDAEAAQEDADIFDLGGRKAEREKRRKIIEDEQISDSIF